MKFVTTRPFADPDTAAHKLVEIANAAEAVQDGRIHIELVNDSFLGAGGTRPNTAPVSNTRSRRAGSGGMRAGLCEVHLGRGRAVCLTECPLQDGKRPRCCPYRGRQPWRFSSSARGNKGWFQRKGPSRGAHEVLCYRRAARQPPPGSI